MIKGEIMKKKFIKFTVLAFFALFFSVSCSNNIDGLETNDRMLTLTTFNAKMTDDLPYKTRRFKKMRDIFAENPSEILCIQDLYGNNLLDEVRKMLKNDYGYDYSLYAKTSNDDEDLESTEAQTIPAACSINDVAPILSCIMTNCPDYNVGCIVQSCWQSFLEIPADCRNCMLSNGIEAIASGNYLEILEKCQQDTRIAAKKLEYEFSGNSGVLLASKLPMSNKTPVKLRSYGRMRTAVAATVEKDGIGKIQVICTGLSPLSEAEYNGFGESWEDEQITQIEQILAIPVSDDVVQRVILGDFNGNPAFGELSENNPEPLSILEENGWYDPYFNSDEEEIDCTVCHDNPFVTEDSPELVPNHILFKNKKGYAFSSERVFVNKFMDLNYENHTKATYSVSDSYGIIAIMTIKH